MRLGAPSRPLAPSLLAGAAAPAAAAAVAGSAPVPRRHSLVGSIDQRRRCRGRHRYRIAASSSGNDDDAPDDDDDSSSSFDIDALASALSRAAEERRRRASEGGASDDSIVDPAPPLQPPQPPQPLPTSSSSSTSFSTSSPFGADAKRREEEVLDELGGDGGFEPDEIELLQELGRVSWITSEPSRNSLNAPKTAAAVYAARYTPPTPLMSPTIVLVKEYFPHASSLACNELQVGARLSSGGQLPTRKWHAARSDGPPPPAPPAALPLLGWFEASSAPSSSQEEEEEEEEGRDFQAGTPPSPSISDPDARSLWLVFKWGGGQPLSFYAQQQQQKSLKATGLAALFPSASTPAKLLEGALRKRGRMVRRIASGATTALATVHAAGVAHGSLGGGCVLLSTFDDAASAKLSVCLDNFGFATMRRSLGNGNVSASADFDDDDDPVLVAQAADARQLGRLLLETALLALGRVQQRSSRDMEGGGEESGREIEIESEGGSSSPLGQEEVNAYASLESAGPAVREAGARVLEAVAAAVSSSSPSSVAARSRSSEDGDNGNELENGEEQEEIDPSILLAAEAARRVCVSSGEWTAAVELLDDDGGAGWELVGALAVGVLPAKLVSSRFFR